MACPTCGSSILFGGIKDGNRKYCSKRCYEADEINRVAGGIPDEVVDEFSKQIHGGRCPRCNGSGPVDVHKSYSVYSVILYTAWRTKEHVLCKRCASRQQITDLAGSFLLGWWGIPFGLLITPVQVLRNVAALFQNPGTKGPTEKLKYRSRLVLAAQHMQNA